MNILIAEDREHLIWSVARALVTDGFVPQFDMTAVKPDFAALLAKYPDSFSEDEIESYRGHYFFDGIKARPHVFERGNDRIVIVASCKALEEALAGPAFDVCFFDSGLSDGHSDKQVAALLRKPKLPRIRLISLDADIQLRDVGDEFLNPDAYAALQASGQVKTGNKDALLVDVLTVLAEAPPPAPKKPAPRKRAAKTAPARKK